MTDTDLINSMADGWAPTYGLVRYEPYYGQQTLAPLFGTTGHDRVHPVEQLHHGTELLDHSRAFKPKGKGNASPTVMVSAPYENSLRRSFASQGKVVDQIHALAEALQLRVRIGHPADRIYDSTPHGLYPVLAIVWWDPARFLMPYPPLPAPTGDLGTEH